MKPSYWIASLVLITLGIGIGFYWAGTNNQPVTDGLEKGQNSSGKILYYRNPMGLADTSPTPKQDSMGMDYLPVYERDLQSTDVVQIDSRKIQLMGVQTQAVKKQPFNHEIRALGTLSIDETRIADISPRFEGWVLSLGNTTVGQRISKGEILFQAQIPGLFFAELAYVQAVKKAVAAASSTTAQKREANIQLSQAMERLEDLGASPEEMQRLQQGGDPYSQMSFRAPASGVVLEKNIFEGSRFASGDRLYQVADLSQLWLIIQLPEHESGKANLGDAIDMLLLAEPGQRRSATVDFIYPIIDTENRGIKIRALVENEDYQLRPGQSVEVWLKTQTRTGLTIPANALLDSGLDQHVLVALGNGVFQPRQITVGERHLEWVEVLEGLAPDEEVVTHANFLIDSESRLQAALANFTQAKAAEQHPDAEHDTHPLKTDIHQHQHQHDQPAESSLKLKKE